MFALHVCVCVDVPNPSLNIYSLVCVCAEVGVFVCMYMEGGGLRAVSLQGSEARSSKRHQIPPCHWISVSVQEAELCSSPQLVIYVALLLVSVSESSLK